MEKISNHSFNLNKLRRLHLILDYEKGLIDDYQYKIDNYVTNKTKTIDRHFAEDSYHLASKLKGIHPNDLKRNSKILKIDEKAYWERRAFINRLHKTETLTNEKQIQMFDEIQKQTVIETKEMIEKTYPHLEFSDLEIQDMQQKISTLEQKRNKQIETIKVKYQKYQMKLQRLIEQQKKKIIKTERLIEELEQSLITFNALNDQKFNQYEIAKDETIQLSVKGLKMFFGGVKAINDLTFDVGYGKIYGLIGPNGAGKTTVFNCVTQFYKRTEGEIIFRNKEGVLVDLNKLAPHDVIKEGISRSFQNVELIWELCVLDNLLIAAHSLLITNFFDHMIHSPKMIKEERVLRQKGIKILENLGILEYAYRFPYGLPYGILKKIELARTLMTDPSLIILDEPAAGLNDIETKDLAQTIKTINQTYHCTIFLVEHDMGLVMSICDEICAISFGKKIASGKPGEIQANPDVRKAYLGDDGDE